MEKTISAIFRFNPSDINVVRNFGFAFAFVVRPFRVAYSEAKASHYKDFIKLTSGRIEKTIAAIFSLKSCGIIPYEPVARGRAAHLLLVQLRLALDAVVLHAASTASSGTNFTS